jgi:hypothetical protein
MKPYIYSMTSNFHSSICNSALMGHVLAKLWKPVGWKCSYGLGDDFLFSAKSETWFMFHKSESIFVEDIQISCHCKFAYTLLHGANTSY